MRISGQKPITLSNRSQGNPLTPNGTAACPCHIPKWNGL